MDLLGVPDGVSLALLVLTGIALVRCMYRAPELVLRLPALSRGKAREATPGWSR